MHKQVVHESLGRRPPPPAPKPRPPQTLEGEEGGVGGLLQWLSDIRVQP